MRLDSLCECVWQEMANINRWELRRICGQHSSWDL